MAYSLNQKIKNLTPYAPIVGHYDIRLDANESFLTLPDDVKKKAMEEALSSPLNRYPDPYATDLVRGFSKYYGVKPEYVTAGNGSDELISLIVGTFFEAGEELVTVVPDFSMYQFYAEVFGVKTTAFTKDESLRIDVERLCQYLIQSKARGVIFSNPCNPTSICLSKRQVHRMLREVPDCLFIVDEAYMDFADESVLSLVDDFDNLIVLRTCSKAIGLAAIRIGFAVAGEKITRAIRSVKSPYNVNTVSQKIGEAVFADPEFLMHAAKKIISSREHLYKGLLALHARYRGFDEVYESATNFVFIRTKYAKELYEGLLARSIAIRFMGGYLRITAGTQEENKAVLAALEELVKEY